MVTKVELDNKVGAIRNEASSRLTGLYTVPAKINKAVTSVLTLSQSMRLSKVQSWDTFEYVNGDDKKAFNETVNILDEVSTDNLIVILESLNTKYFKPGTREGGNAIENLSSMLIYPVTTSLNKRSDKFVYLASDECEEETDMLTVNNIGRSYRSYWESESTVLSEGAL